MNEQQDFQRCGAGCCCYINGEPVTDDVFQASTEQSQSPHTSIGCLNDASNQFASQQTKFYLGIPVAGATSVSFYVYASESHQYLGLGTPQHQQEWQSAKETFKADQKGKKK